MFVIIVSIHLAPGFGKKPFQRIHEIKKRSTNVSIFLCIYVQFQNLFEDSLENNSLSVNMNFISAIVLGIVFNIVFFQFFKIFLF